MLLTIAVWSVNQSFFPYYIKLLIDGLPKALDGSLSILRTLQFPLLGICCTWCLMEISARAQGIVSAMFFPKFSAYIREAVISNFGNFNYQFFLENSPGSILSKINDLVKSSQKIYEIFIYSFFGIGVSLIISLFIVSRINLILALLFLWWNGVHLLISLSCYKKINKTMEDHAHSTSLLNSKIIDYLSNNLSVKVFNQQAYEENYFSISQQGEMKQFRRSFLSSEKMKSMHSLVSFLFISSMLLCSLLMLARNEITLGDFSLITMTAFSSLNLLWHLGYQMIQLFRELGNINAALSLIGQKMVSQKPRVVDKKLVITQGNIEFKNVTFAYKPESPVFYDLNFSIRGKSKIALIGCSGAGKTTIAKLIMGLYDIKKGEILIDNQNISKIQTSSLRANVAMLTQEPTLFHRSIWENISYGCPYTSQEQIIQAAKAALCHDFIVKLKEGYNYIVGEKGDKLSGGERQRIAIARTLLKNAPILILDEPTSALDPLTRTAIYDNLIEFSQNKTIIIIAHTYSFLEKVDKILIIKNGAIKEASKNNIFVREDTLLQMRSNLFSS